MIIRQCGVHLSECQVRIFEGDCLRGHPHLVSADDTAYRQSGAGNLRSSIAYSRIPFNEVSPDSQGDKAPAHSERHLPRNLRETPEAWGNRDILHEASIEIFRDSYTAATQQHRPADHNQALPAVIALSVSRPEADGPRPLVRSSYSAHGQFLPNRAQGSPGFESSSMPPHHSAGSKGRRGG